MVYFEIHYPFNKVGLTTSLRNHNYVKRFKNTAKRNITEGEKWKVFEHRHGIPPSSTWMAKE
jgi:hypothetical protein